MLALLQLLVVGVVGVGVGVVVVTVAAVEEGGAVGGEGVEFAFAGVDVGFVVAEAGVQAGADGGGDVLFFDAHGVEL